MDGFCKQLLRKKHVHFFKRFLKILPANLSSFDSTRLSIAFFALSGLDILNALDEICDTREQIINWIYSLQILPSGDGSMEKCGFQGSDTLNILVDNEVVHCNNKFACSHLAMTYTGLATLIILGDDLSRVNKQAVIQGVKSLQQQDGSFCAMQMSSESDMRFVYCAACVCYILQDWTGMDISKTIDYISCSMSYDFGFGQAPNLESHGGVTYCAVAALTLMGKLSTTLSKKQLEGLRRWAVMKQVSGFQGRANKEVDTCYSFWIGATLDMLNVFDKVDWYQNRCYILSTQDQLTGGFSKCEDAQPDPLHTYLGLGALSLMKEDGLLQINSALNITIRAAKYLHELHASWV